MIIFNWVKYQYKRLPMGIENSPENFQQKMNNIFHVFEVIRAYIDDLLVLPKGYWKYHVQKLELTLSR